MIRIVLADDHPVVREGIRGMLQGYDDIEVVGQAGSGPEAVALVAALAPDLVLMDLRMPGGDGVEATRTIVAAHPATRVVVLTTYETDQDILRAIEAGASGYLLKDIAPAELARSVRSAAAGETVLATSAVTALLGRVQGRQAAPALSVQEVRVLRLAADGRTNAAIGSELFIGEATVKTYLSRAYEKLGVSDRTSAVRRALELGLLD
ncbi:response regulator transcription factor [Leifsonia sp. 21MFCrub1.1]|uniref:response regulator transcription factor n=1 Tax=Leifsonia sp. 21MFCrub1.1 TaxID=1798223 RepID=UPI00089297E2|nr:response regulator transcription factor [Leifsonia sp. 21MFCrub1.1]SEB14895.1 DNA-binding response regulator, NarL/FixJ family, contains REC and HTH domains [Leifsonia sp. 21MFCrub1.1]